MRSLRVALLGYGRMGKAIEEAAYDRGHQIVLRATAHKLVQLDQLREADVALDFSSAAAVEQHLYLCADAGTSLVIGTTGWNLTSERIHDASKKIGIVIGANFSVGIALVRHLAVQLGQLLIPTLNYQLHIHELHHRAKRDHPSGTALMLARTLQQHLCFDASIVSDLSQPIDDRTITVSSARVGSIVGTHTIIADSEADTIEITHRAKSRRGFALGAMLAAEWIAGKRGLYDFSDVALEIFHSLASK